MQLICNFYQRPEYPVKIDKCNVNLFALVADKNVVSNCLKNGHGIKFKEIVDNIPEVSK